MFVSRGHNFGVEPAIYGALPSEYFTNLRHAASVPGYSHKGMAEFWWPGCITFLPFEEGSKASPIEVIGACLPIVELIAELHQVQYGTSPKEIILSIDTNEVKPQKAQRIPIWHVDGYDGELPPYWLVSADTLPTQALVGEIKRKRQQHHLERKGKEFIATNTVPHLSADDVNPLLCGISTLEDNELKRIGLKVFQALPRELMVLTSETVHRSVVNTSNRSIPRTWLRALVLS